MNREIDVEDADGSVFRVIQVGIAVDSDVLLRRIVAPAGRRGIPDRSVPDR